MELHRTEPHRNAPHTNRTVFTPQPFQPAANLEFRNLRASMSLYQSSSCDPSIRVLLLVREAVHLVSCFEVFVNSKTYCCWFAFMIAILKVTTPYGMPQQGEVNLGDWDSQDPLSGILFRETLTFTCPNPPKPRNLKPLKPEPLNP